MFLISYSSFKIKSDKSALNCNLTGSIPHTGSSLCSFDREESGMVGFPQLAWGGREGSGPPYKGYTYNTHSVSQLTLIYF